MRSRLWGVGMAQFVFAVLVGAIVCWVAVTAAYGHDPVLTWIMAVVVVLLLAILFVVHLTSREFTPQGIKAIVKRTIRHNTAIPQFAAVKVYNLSGGQGGWTRSRHLLWDGNAYFIPGAHELQDEPPIGEAVLIVRDDHGRYHLFRFGDKHQASPPKRRDCIGLELIDHGVLGPDRFSVDLAGG